MRDHNASGVYSTVVDISAFATIADVFGTDGVHIDVISVNHHEGAITVQASSDNLEVLNQWHALTQDAASRYLEDTV